LGSGRCRLIAASLSAAILWVGPALPLAAEPPAGAERPNIVFICVDGLSTGMTGFTGNPLIKTPNLDRLAAESAQFDRAYVTMPQAMGSRVSMLTGQPPHMHGIVNDTAPLSPRAVSFTEVLAKAGYECGLLGVWALPAPGAQPPPPVNPPTMPPLVTAPPAAPPPVVNRPPVVNPPPVVSPPGVTHPPVGPSGPAAPHVLPNPPTGNPPTPGAPRPRRGSRTPSTNPPQNLPGSGLGTPMPPPGSTPLPKPQSLAPDEPRQQPTASMPVSAPAGPVSPLSPPRHRASGFQNTVTPPQAVSQPAASQPARLTGRDAREPERPPMPPMPPMPELQRPAGAVASHPQEVPLPAPPVPGAVGSHPSSPGSTPGPVPPAGTPTRRDSQFTPGPESPHAGPMPSPPPPPPGRPGLGFNRHYAISEPSGPLQGAQVNVKGERRTADRYLPDWYTDRAVEFIRESKDKPFCLCLFLPGPGDQPASPPGAENLYPPASLPLPQKKPVDTRNLPGRLAASPPVQNCSRMQPEVLRQNQSRYYAFVTHMDANVGRVLNAIDETSLKGRTIVVFASGAGYATGENGVWGTGPILWEPFVRCPLLIRLPQAGPAGTTTSPSDATASAGRRIPQLVSMADIAPTLLEVLGLPAPVGMAGNSLVSLLRGGEPDLPEECFIEYDGQGGQRYPARAIVTEQFKLVDYLQDPDQFYDRKRDSGEERNIVDEPAYNAVVKVLRARLERWRKRTRDPMN
jgi:arylsulfatase A-like enzyme